ncbi:unnamed protein product [Microthlaspi erraticum]|uniref:Peptidase A1 domain-containing protein n=1 Tax=Microthlaspi erraticum TaxID=1685480 RepID=A0A6D2IQ96_9BRAS|nr:unnamed protein product [Microthlaspi erraticum]
MTTLVLTRLSTLARAIPRERLVSTTSGIVGLNWAATSLTSQMGERFLGLLSYCFSGTGTSKINFGANAIVAGDGTVAADIREHVIDSGTTYTFLPGSYLEQVKAAVESVVTAERAPSTYGMLCYYSNLIDIFPVITMHFSGGADLVLDNNNVYVNMGGGGSFCLALMDGDPMQVSIFGNRAQNNFLVGYDPSSMVVSFKPTDCSALF